MEAIEAIVYNLEEVRRRSCKAWRAIPKETLGWRPDSEAMSCQEIVRHVLDSEHYYHLALINRDSLENYLSPFKGDYD